MSRPQWYLCLDVWMALGGKSSDFEDWRNGRTWADAWAQLMAAIRGDLVGLMADNNPTAGLLLALVEPPIGGNDDQ